VLQNSYSTYATQVRQSGVICTTYEQIANHVPQNEL
jgi:hypothetical protein